MLFVTKKKEKKKKDVLNSPYRKLLLEIVEHLGPSVFILVMLHLERLILPCHLPDREPGFDPYQGYTCTLFSHVASGTEYQLVNIQNIT